MEAELWRQLSVPDSRCGPAEEAVVVEEESGETVVVVVEEETCSGS